MTESKSPDVRLLAGEKLGESPFPAAHAAEFRIHFHPAAHGRAVAHAKESTSVEICGVLVGDFARDADGPYVRITDIIRCDNATQKFAEVTFTHDSWTQINREMDTKFANLRIVGWYHSHPDFGIFLSDRDVFIQQNFFSGPGQIAFVVDPVRDAEGVFEWRDGQPKLAAHYWVGGKITGGELTARGGGQVGGPESARGVSGLGPLSSSPVMSDSNEPPMSWRSLLTVLLLAVLCFLVGQLWGSQRSRWEELRLTEGTIAHFGLWKGLRPGLEESLASLRGEMGAVLKRIKALSDDHVKLVGDKSKETAKDWSDIQNSLASSRDLVKQMEERYAWTPEEQHAIARLTMQKLMELRAQQEALRERGSKPVPEGIDSQTWPKGDSAEKKAKEPKASGKKSETGSS